MQAIRELVNLPNALPVEVSDPTFDGAFESNMRKLGYHPWSSRIFRISAIF